MIKMFMLQSLDGKISTGMSERYDFDRDLPKFKGNVADGLHQYYDIEKTQYPATIISGKTLHKIGVNNAGWADNREKLENVTIIVLDNHHLFATGCENLTKVYGKVYIISSNGFHFGEKTDGVKMIFTASEKETLRNIKALMARRGIKDMVLQGGGYLNHCFLKAGLVDCVDIIVCPIIVGDRQAPDLAGAEGANWVIEDMPRLKNVETEMLENGYIRYKADIDK